jgi:hypothetical protein
MEPPATHRAHGLSSAPKGRRQHTTTGITDARGMGLQVRTEGTGWHAPQPPLHHPGAGKGPSLISRVTGPRSAMQRLCQISAIRHSGE